VCLPEGLRTGPPPDTARRDPDPAPPPSDAQGKLEYSIGKIVDFAEVMDLAGDVVGQLKAETPRFEGWNLAPVAGIPAIGLMFVGRMNTISDTWSDCAGLLREVLERDGDLLFKVAENYQTVHQRTVDTINASNR
jgi:hypothetical protein